MGDFASEMTLDQLVYSTLSVDSIGMQLLAVNANAAATTYPSANYAIFIPVQVQQPFVARQMFITSGTASGNVDVGIYNPNGARLVSIGSTAQAGATAIQKFDITDTTLMPGLYYMALAHDTAAGTIFGTASTLVVAYLRTCGVRGMATAFPLPATATYAAATQAFVPYLAMTSRAVLT